MSYKDVLARVHSILEKVPGVEAVLSYEPTQIHVTPLVYSLLDSAEREHGGQLVSMRYRILHRLIVRWQDNENSEQDLIPFLNSIPIAFDSAPRSLLMPQIETTKIESAQAVWVSIGGTIYRAIDFYSTTLEKGGRGLGI